MAFNSLVAPISVGLSTGSSEAVSAFLENNATWAQGLDNAFTGNLDYQREKSILRLQNAFNAEQAQLNRDFQSSEAQLNRDFQERLSNTAYSRAIADLKRNGLNPYLSVTSGLSASSPSGNAPSGASATSGSGGRGHYGGTGWDILGRMLGTVITSAFGLSEAEALATSRLAAAELSRRRGYTITSYNSRGARIGWRDVDYK